MICMERSPHLDTSVWAWCMALCAMQMPLGMVGVPLGPQPHLCQTPSSWLFLNTLRDSRASGLKIVELCSDEK